MRSIPSAALGAIAAVVALAAPAVASAALPGVGSGQPPGPPLLYQGPPAAPQLSNTAPFAAAPLLVSGTDAYRGGEFIYQDFLFDDRGADTVPLEGSRPDNLSSDNFSPTAGDVQYPSAAKFANNAADLVELRIKPTEDAILYRVTLNTVAGPDSAAVGIGIDADRSGGAAVAWPKGAGVSSPGLDSFITAWGTGGSVTSLPGGAETPLPPGSVSIDTATRQMTISVPRTILDPGTDTWRYVAGTGLWNAAAGTWQAPATSASPTAAAGASGNAQIGAPAVLNLAFRFDEPQLKQPQQPSLPYSTGPGVGNWMEDKQAFLLGAQGGATTSAGGAGGADFSEDVDFGELAAHADADLHAPKATQQRIFASALDLPDGVKPGFPEYGGQLQPYTVRVPPGHAAGEPWGMTFALHSLGGNYNQFAVFSPNQYKQFGDERDNLVVTPLAHGPDGWYTGGAESDVFEVWADLNRHFDLDPQRSYLSGYSMGGYGTYKLGTEYPDLWAKAFTTVGPPGEGIWIPGSEPSSGADTLSQRLLENVRWVPYLNWAGSSDELVPVAGPVAQQQRFDQLGLRSQLWIFAPADHFALAVADGWAKARDFLGDATVTEDPSRVDYGFYPAADRPALGLRHDHAYWVSQLRARNTAGAGAIGRIAARSLAFGEGDPATAPVQGGGLDAGPPLAYVASGTSWGAIPAAPPANTLQLTLTNLESGTVDGPRARLAAADGLRIETTTDGASDLRLALPFATGTQAHRLEGGNLVPAPEVTIDAGGAAFALSSAGSRTYVFDVPGAGGPGGGGTGGGGPGGGAGTPGASGSPGPAGAGPMRCKGRPATILGSASGTSPATLRGTAGDDVILARNGRDRIFGGGGDDVLCGGAGRDTLRGGPGADVCFGGPGRDRISRSCEISHSPRRKSH